MYCEGPRLSLRGPGHVYWAIDAKKRRDLETIDLKELEEILDALAAGLDLEHPKLPCGPAAYDRRHQIYASPVYKKAREWRFANL